MAKSYFERMKPTSVCPPRLVPEQIAYSGLAGALGFLSLYIPSHYLTDLDALYIIGPFGSTAALLWGSQDAGVSQPRSVIGGHFLSSIYGVTIAKVAVALSLGPWVAGPLAIVGAIAVMQATRTFHPAGAGTALLACVGSAGLRDLGYLYCLAPIGTGAVALVLTAAVINNMIPGRQYPRWWY